MVHRINKIDYWIWAGILLLFLVSFSLLVATPINDPDFFWHLLTGRWIWEHKAIPSEDPFNFTTPSDAYKFIRTLFILQSYWLGQLIICGIYNIGGYYGIVIFRSLMFTIMLIFLLKWLRKKGVKIHSTLIFLILPAYILGEFVGERPNQMSFLMALIAFYFIEETRARSKKGFFLPFVIAVWANIHGGFILGVVIILIYMFAETLKKLYAMYKGEAYRGYGFIILIYSISLISGFLNPQGYNAFPLLKELTPLYETISEHQTPLTIMRVTRTSLYANIVIFCILLSVTHVVLSVKKKQIDFAHLLLLFFLILLSLKSIRYIPFLGLLITPVISNSLSEPVEKLIAKIKGYGIPQVCLCTMLFITFYIEYKNTILIKPVLSENFPVRAIELLKERELKGNIFNFLDFGGYIEWKLYPEKRTFIDGRNLVVSIYIAHDNVMRGTSDWNNILESYGVRNILIPPVTRTGAILGLTFKLYKDKRWKLVYGDSSTLFFSMDESIQELPKSLMFAYVATAANNLSGSDNPLPYISVAMALEHLSRRNDAIIYLEEAIRKRPSLEKSEVGWELRRLKSDRSL